MKKGTGIQCLCHGEIRGPPFVSSQAGNLQLRFEGIPFLISPCAVGADSHTASRVVSAPT